MLISTLKNRDFMLGVRGGMMMKWSERYRCGCRVMDVLNCFYTVMLACAASDGCVNPIVFLWS